MPRPPRAPTRRGRRPLARRSRRSRGRAARRARRARARGRRARRGGGGRCRRRPPRDRPRGARAGAGRERVPDGALDERAQEPPRRARARRRSARARAGRRRAAARSRSRRACRRGCGSGRSASANGTGRRPRSVARAVASVALASSPPVTPANAPSSCSGPRSSTIVCIGWIAKRRGRPAPSASSGVAPENMPSQGPSPTACAQAAIASSGTARRTSSASRPAATSRTRRTSRPSAASRACTAVPTRPGPTTVVLTGYPSGEDGVLAANGSRGPARAVVLRRRGNGVRRRIRSRRLEPRRQAGERRRSSLTGEACSLVAPCQAPRSNAPPRTRSPPT